MLMGCLHDNVRCYLPISRHSGKLLSTQKTSHRVVPDRLLTKASFNLLSSGSCC